MIEGPLIALVGAVLVALIATDGIAWMFGRRFPATRFAIRALRRVVGGAFVSTGRMISGRRDNRRGGGGGNR